MRKRWFRALFRRRIIVSLLLFLQIVFLIRLVSSGSRVFQNLNYLLTMLSFLVVIHHIVSEKTKVPIRLHGFF